MQRARPAGSRRHTWSPGRRLRPVLLAATVGSVGGLAFGLLSVNRPVLNAAVFYVLGAAVAAVSASLVVLARPRRRTGPTSRRPAAPSHPSRTESS